MRRFLQMLLAVLFCTTAMCITDVSGATSTSSNAYKKTIVVNTNTDQKSDQKSVQNTVQNTKSSTVNSNSPAFSEEEVYLTAQLIHHEAHNQPYNGKVAIAEVVLNRIRSKHFPSSIEEVIFQTGQFSNSRRIKNIAPTDLEVRIADKVLNDKLRVFNDTDILYFRNPSVTCGVDASTERDWGELDYVTSIGDHAFYSQEPVKTMVSVAKTTDKKDIVVTKAEPKVNKDNSSDTKSDVKDSAAKASDSKVEEAAPENEETVLGPEYVSNEMLLAAANIAAVNMAITKAKEEEIDESDPVALAQRQARLDAEREEKQRAAMQAEYDKARQAETSEAQKNVMQATMRVEVQNNILVEAMKAEAARFAK